MYVLMILRAGCGVACVIVAVCVDGLGRKVMLTVPSVRWM